LLAPIAEDTGMAQQGNPDDLDRDLPLNEEDAKGLGDEEFEDVEEGDEAGLEDEDEVAEKE
jgi:hypothetical protein